MPSLCAAATVLKRINTFFLKYDCSQIARLTEIEDISSFQNDATSEPVKTEGTCNTSETSTK